MKKHLLLALMLGMFSAGIGLFATSIVISEPAIAGGCSGRCR